MSLIHIAKALKTKVGNTTTKFVLVKLADNANDDGVCWPSYNHIADQCEISRRSAMRHVKILVELGLISVTYRSGEKGNSSNVFRLKLDSVTSDKLSPPSDEVVTEDHQPSDTQTPPPSDTVSPRTSHSFEPVSEPKESARKKSKLIQKSRLENSELPEQLNTVAWAQWLDYRAKLKKPFKTPRGERRAMNELIKLSQGDQTLQQRIVDQSIDFEWVGLFELKTQRGSGKPSVPLANQVGAADADYSRPEGF
ncbi:helix-turn-helix domain-containing protein [Vibrio rumoiensis]|uniref:helix-turn-helix domain-containing protein n=1 Tax=Vibrio rumoiensis TaxID=76258 RepID=UPI003AA82121